MRKLLAIYSDRFKQIGFKKSGSSFIINKSKPKANKDGETDEESITKDDKVCYIDLDSKLITRKKGTQFIRNELYKQIEGKFADNTLYVDNIVLEIPMQISAEIESYNIHNGKDIFKLSDGKEITVKDDTIVIHDMLDEFKDLVKDEPTSDLDLLMDIKLINNNWNCELTDDEIRQLVIDYNNDSSEIKSEKSRIRALLDFKKSLEISKIGELKSDTEDDEDRHIEESTDEEYLDVSTKVKNQESLEEEPTELIGDAHCPICHGTGKYINPKFGLVTICSCVEKVRMKKEREQSRLAQISKIKVQATKGEQEAAFRDNLIPEHRKNDVFNINEMQIRAKRVCNENNIRVVADTYKNYITALAKINTSLGSGEGLNKSYIISAPNGFSKTTFANSCIANLYGKGKKMVPYKSLAEIATLLIRETANYNYLRNRQFNRIINKKEGEYDWNDYCTAYLVFCFLTIPEYAEVELSTLKSLLSIRGNAGLATVVFTERPINAYNVSGDVGLYLMSDMFSSHESMSRLDRPLKVEVVKTFNANMKVEKGKDI